MQIRSVFSKNTCKPKPLFQSCIHTKLCGPRRTVNGDISKHLREKKTVNNAVNQENVRVEVEVEQTSSNVITGVLKMHLSAPGRPIHISG